MRSMLALAMVAGCVGTAADAPTVDAVDEQLVALPTVEHAAGLAREPMIVQMPDGTLFVTGYGEERPMLWRSDDGGASWRSVDVGDAADGAVGNSDVDLARGPDGTLYFVVMAFDRQTFEGTGIAVGASEDAGSTWRWSSLSATRFDDRPWIEVASDGSAHVIWNDGAGVRHAVSGDRGRTWTERGRIHNAGGSSHLAAGPGGRLAVRITPLSASGNRHDPGVDLIALSSDAGATWQMGELPGTRAWSTSFDPADGVLRWVEPVAWDSAGALFALWSEGTTLRLARSKDDGDTWTQWPVIEDSVALYFPYLAARGDGELAATWHAGVADDLRTHVATIRMMEAGPPRVHVAAAFQSPAFRVPEGGTEPVREPAGEYVPVAFLRDGRIAVVTPIQDVAGERFGFTFRPYRLEANQE